MKKNKGMSSKNILFFTRTMGLGGTENVILQLCENFKGNFNKIIVCSCGGINEEKLKNMNIRHYCIDDIEKKNVLVVIKTLMTLIRIINKEKINIIHTHHRMAAFYSKIISKIYNIKIIHTAHNTFYNKKLLTRFSLKNINIVAVGNRVKENLIQFYDIPDKDINVIYNGIKENYEFEEIGLLKRLHEQGFFLVGNIGRISEQKGVEYFVKAIPSIVRRYENFKFIIVGTGELEETIKKKCKELNIYESVIFMGYRNDVQNVISNLDLVVLSSLWEGLPLIPIETFSVRKTIIATDVDGTSEIVKDGYNGILIKAKSSEEISENIIRLYTNSEEIRRLEDNAYKTYKMKFSIDKFVNNYSNYYNKLMEVQ